MEKAVYRGIFLKHEKGYSDIHSSIGELGAVRSIEIKLQGPTPKGS